MDVEGAQRMANKQLGMMRRICLANRMRASVVDYLAGPPDHKRLAGLCMEYGEEEVLQEIDRREN